MVLGLIIFLQGFTSSPAVYTETVKSAGSSQNESQNGSSRTGRRRATPSRTCSEEQLAEREELRQKCKTDFQKMGVEYLITESELVPENSCPAIENTVDQFAGCSAAFFETTDFVISLFRNLSGAELRKMAKEQCLENLEEDQAFRRRGRPSAELAQCVSSTVASIDRQAQQAQAEVEQNWPKMLEECQAELEQFSETEFTSGQRRRGRHWQKASYKEARFECLLREATRLDCNACIDKVNEAKQISLSPSLMQQVLDDLDRRTAFQCYNGYEQGRMACEVLILAAAPAAGLSAKLTRRLGLRSLDESTQRARSQIERGIARAIDAGEDSPEIRALFAQNVMRERLGVDRVLNPAQSEAVWRAHLLGVPDAYGNYSSEVIKQKGLMLREAGFSPQEIRVLMEARVVGRPGQAGVGTGFRNPAAIKVLDEDAILQLFQGPRGLNSIYDPLLNRSEMMQNAVAGYSNTIVRAAKKEAGAHPLPQLIESSSVFRKFARDTARNQRFSVDDLPDLAAFNRAESVSPAAANARAYLSTHLVDAAQQMRRSTTVAERRAAAQGLSSDLRALGFGEDYLSRPGNLEFATHRISAEGSSGAVYLRALEARALLGHRQAQLMDAIEVARSGRRDVFNVSGPASSNPGVTSGSGLRQELRRVEEAIEAVERTLRQIESGH